MGNHLEIAYVTAAMATSGATQDFTVSGFDPTGTEIKGALFVWTRASVMETHEAHMVMGIGMTDGTRSRASTYFSEDAQPDTDAFCINANDAPVLVITKIGAGAIEARATFNSFITDGVRLNWTVNPATGWFVTCILIKAKSLRVNDADNSSGSAHITDLGFEFSTLILASTRTAFTTSLSIFSASTHAYLSVGLVMNDGAGFVMQGSHNYNEQNAQASGSPRAYVSDSEALVHNVGNTTTGGVVISTVDAAGFNADQIGGAGVPFAYMAIEHDNLAEVNHETCPTTEIEQNLNLYPANGIIILQSGCPALNTHTTTIAGSFGIGVSTAINTGVMHSTTCAASATTDNSSYVSDDGLIRTRTAVMTGNLCSANLTALDSSDVITLDWVEAPATTRRFLALTIQKAFSGTGSGSFPLLTGSAAGNQRFVGTGSGSFPLLTASSTGNERFIATGSGSFPLLTGSAQGTAKYTATGAGTFPLLTGSAQGAVRYVATGAGSFPLLTGSTTGSQSFSGTASGSFPLLTASATGNEVFAAVGAGSFPLPTAAGTGIHTEPGVYSGTGSGSFPLLTGQATGAQRFVATGAGSFPLLTAAGTANEVFTGTEAGAFPLVTAAGVGFTTDQEIFTGSGSGVFPLLRGLGSGNLIFVAVGSGVFPLLTAHGTGMLDVGFLEGLEVDWHIPATVTTATIPGSGRSWSITGSGRTWTIPLE